jgi:hypothetical protein
MTVVVACDRCQRLEPISANALPDGWLAWPLGWPDVLGGPPQDLCPGCVSEYERRALAERLAHEAIEAER